jgi:predicted dehydrogenase
MDKVRLGVIGCGGMGQNHMRRYYRELDRLHFAAASDVVADNLKVVVDEYGVEGFDDAEAMLDSGLIDAVFIATPHYFHPRYSIAAMQRGLHVLTEKPVAVTAKAAAEVNAVHAQNPQLIYAAMFQMRAMDKWQKVYDLIRDGELGEIKRMQWTATKWFRSQYYYDSGAWRATWAGEGGGVLMNQCPHNLDMLCRLFGVPTRVTARVGLGKYHDIEVEDDVTALLEFENGATGVFVTSSGEAPGIDRLEVIGDRGRLTVDGRGEQQILLDQTACSVSEYCRTTESRMSEPQMTRREIKVNDEPVHRNIAQNFLDAIIDGAPLLSLGDEGLHSVELANAMLMSGLEGKPIDIPMDRDRFEAMLEQLIESSKAQV